ncbi:MAG: Ig-like domain-containing protein [Clostridia bacterium]|nr:Ig-like domain-containing protein [Clostridia bacterium]
MKRIISVLICALIVLSTFAVCTFTASAAVGDYTAAEPVLYSADVNILPEAANYNDLITFTVVTDTNTSKVKICGENGAIFTLANALDGFNGYTDSGSRRTWTFSKRIQIIEPKDLYIYAGNCCYGYSDSEVVIESQNTIINVTSVTLNKSTLSLTVGQTSALTATVSPQNATNKTVAWSTSDGSVATVSNGTVTAVAAGTATITATADGKSAQCVVTVTAQGEPDLTEPPYPFWKNYLTYTGGETVYYKGKIYTCNYWAKGQDYNPEAKQGAEWTLVGDAEWTVPEDDKNYTYESDPDLYADIGTVVQLTDEQAIEKWGALNTAYLPENAVAHFTELLPREDYEALFPYRFGSDNWKNLPIQYPQFSDTKYDLAARQTKTDYYSYDNLISAVEWLANSMIMIQNVEDADYCTRITCFDKTTKQEIVLSQDGDWIAEWNITKPRVTKIVDLGAFLADGTLSERKRELAAFLANISHETGGGWLEGQIDELYTGLYWNEEVNHIGATSSGYLNTAYDYYPGVSYHGRGPIQLSWNFNYAQFSGIVYGDCGVLLEHPETVASDGVLGFMSAIWFWMTPQPPKPACHEVMIDGLWTPSAKDIAQGRSEPGFGMTIMIINGGLEGNCTESDGRVGRRIRYYRHYTDIMNVDITGEKLDTAGMMSFYATTT